MSLFDVLFVSGVVFISVLAAVALMSPWVRAFSEWYEPWVYDFVHRRCTRRNK